MPTLETFKYRVIPQYKSKFALWLYKDKHAAFVFYSHVRMYKPKPIEIAVKAR